MTNQYTPNEIIVDRAVELWKRALRKPEYQMLGKEDNNILDLKRQSFVEMTLTLGNINNSDEEVLQKFGEELKKILMTDSERGFRRRLSVDYDSCQELNIAAELSGLKANFPIKTEMYLYKDNVSFSQGYAAPYIRHYPLPDGKWLITDLTGDDMQHVIKHIAEGGPLQLTIEG